MDYELTRRSSSGSIVRGRENRGSQKGQRSFKSGSIPEYAPDSPHAKSERSAEDGCREDDDEALVGEASLYHEGMDGEEDGDGNGVINLDTINETINNLSSRWMQRLQEKQTVVLVLIIAPDTHSSYKEFTLRELYDYIMDDIDSYTSAESNQSASPDPNSAEPTSPTLPREESVSSNMSLFSITQVIANTKSSSNLLGLSENNSTIKLTKSTRRASNTFHPKAGLKREELDSSKPMSYDFSRKQNFSSNTGAAQDLRYRDLRRLGYEFNPHEEPTLLVRKHVILISLDPIRAIITADKLILIVPQGADDLLLILKEHMQDWVSNTKPDLEETLGDDRERVEEDISDNSKRSPSLGLKGMDEAKNDESAISSSRNSLTHNVVRGQLSITSDSAKAGSNDGDRNDNLDLDSLIPFEAKAYEAVLATVIAIQQGEFDKMHRRVTSLLGHFKGFSIVNVKYQEAMRIEKNLIAKHIGVVNAYRRWLDDLLEDDEKTALMNLTRLKADPSLYEYPLRPEILQYHEEIETLLDSFLRDYSTLEAEIENTRTEIQSAEELVMLKLDTSRNELLQVNTIFTIVAVNIAFGSLVSGLFGMNLDNSSYFQDIAGVFTAVCLSVFVVIVVSIVCTTAYLQYTGVLPSKESARSSPKKEGGKIYRRGSIRSSY